MDVGAKIKTCSKCSDVKPIIEFRKQKKGKYGVMSVCKSCQSKIDKENRLTGNSTSKIRNKRHYLLHKEKCKKEGKNYREKLENKITKKEYDKVYREQNKDKIKNNNKLYREKNFESLKLKKIKYNNDNKKIVNFRKNEYRKRFEIENPHIVAWRSVLKNSLSRLGKDKEGHTVDLLGYSAIELHNHIISLFTEGMSWDNHGEWHIDHIKRVSDFIKDTHPSIVNALSNLRPLWSTTREINGVIYEGNLNRGKF